MPVSFQGAEKRQPEKAHITGQVLAENLSRNRGSLARHEAGRGGGGSGNRKINDLIRAKEVGGRDASPRSADVQGLGEFDELGARRVRSPHKNGNLQT